MHPMKIDQRGFTLVEMLIAMSIFVGVIMITGNAFNKIQSYSSRLNRGEESNIEGMVGLEMLRHDLESAGYGLFDSYDPNYSTPRFIEAAVAPASNYNDGQGTASDAHVPRAVTGGNDLGTQSTTDDGGVSYSVIPGTDYLAVRSTSVGKNIAGQKWTYLSYSSNGGAPHNWQSGADNIPSGSWTIMIKRAFSPTGNTNQLVVDNSQANSSTNYFSTTYQVSGWGAPGTANFSPSVPNSIHFIYGVSQSGGTNAPNMPFNRADYFIARPPNANIPAVCANDSLVGTLYKATVSQGTSNPGKLNYMPIMDCVIDFQVVLGWDTDGDGSLDTWSKADGTGAIGLTGDVSGFFNDANKMSNSLKMIKVFVLAQNGRYDPSYTAPATISIGDPLQASENSFTRTYTIPASLSHYRWKLFKIVARPKNLLVNQ
jgi:prepilin-type N-terminal cleavage/methylation domain-containing protein